MKILYLAFTLLSVKFTLGQTPDWTGLKLFAGRATDYGVGIYIDNHDNYYLTGTMFSPSFLGGDSLMEGCKAIFYPQSNRLNGFLLRYDSNKILNLVLTLNPGTYGEPRVDNAGNIIVSGIFDYGASRDGFLRKYSSSGNILWTKLLQSYATGQSDDVITSLDIFNDGSIVISGFSYGNQVSLFGTIISGPSNFIAKLNALGDIQWINNFTSTLGLGVYKVKFDKDGDIIIAGNERNIGTNSVDGMIGKLSGTTGNLVWKKNFISSGGPFINSIGSFSNKYVFGGTFGGQMKIGDSTFNSRGQIDIVFLQTDSAGNLIWVKKGGSSGRDIVYSLMCDQAGNTLATGGFSNGFQFQSAILPAKGYTDVYILSLNSNGSLLWIKNGGSSIPGHDDLSYEEYGSGIAVDSKNQIQVIGTTIGAGNFGSLIFNAPENIKQNAFWLTLGKKNNSDIVNYPCNRDSSFFLSVFPNPFHEMLSIKNSQNKMVKYDIQLYNTLGQSLYTKTDNTVTMTINDWRTFPSGIYFLKVKIGNYKQTFKIVKQ